MVDVIQVLAIGVGTGFGSAVGTELARYVVGRLKSSNKYEEVY